MSAVGAEPAGGHCGRQAAGRSVPAANADPECSTGAVCP